MKMNEIIYEVAQLDELNPIDRYKFIRTNLVDTNLILLNHKSVYLGDTILLGLYAVYSVIGKKIKDDRYIYIRSDQSIKYIIKHALDNTIDDEMFLKAMVVIDQAKLIYRFTCALKFEVIDAKEKQIRINSWGRIYVESLLKNRDYKGLYQRISCYVEEIYSDKKDIYDEIIMNLFGDKKNHEIVNKLNAKLDVKLLA